MFDQTFTCAAPSGEIACLHLRAGRPEGMRCAVKLTGMISPAAGALRLLRSGDPALSNAYPSVRAPSDCL